MSGQSDELIGLSNQEQAECIAQHYLKISNIPTKNFSPIHALVRVHEAKVSNSQYLIKEFKEITGNQNTLISLIRAN